MRCLVAVEDAAVRDTVAHAAESFPDVHVDAVDLDQCREQIARRRYDFAFLTYRTGNPDSLELWQKMRAAAPDLPIVALSPASGIEGNRAERARLRAFAWLPVPLDVIKVYETLGRLIGRLSGRRRRTPGG